MGSTIASIGVGSGSSRSCSASASTACASASSARSMASCCDRPPATQPGKSETRRRMSPWDRAPAPPDRTVSSSGLLDCYAISHTPMCQITHQSRLRGQSRKMLLRIDLDQIRLRLRSIPDPHSNSRLRLDIRPGKALKRRAIPASSASGFAMDYSQFFSTALNRLHEERRYRVFADLERIAGRFPHAVWHSPQGPAQRRDLVLQRLSRHGPAPEGGRRHGRDRNARRHRRGRHPQHRRHPSSAGAARGRTRRPPWQGSLAAVHLGLCLEPHRHFDHRKTDSELL